MRVCIVTVDARSMYSLYQCHPGHKSWYCTSAIQGINNGRCYVSVIQVTDIVSFLACFLLKGDNIKVSFLIELA